MCRGRALRPNRRETRGGHVGADEFVHAQLWFNDIGADVDFPAPIEPAGTITEGVFSLTERSRKTSRPFLYFLNHADFLDLLNYLIRLVDVDPRLHFEPSARVRLS
jgi:hypothetical protein